MTALHYAAYGQRTDTAELLLSHGADVNARNTDGATPLHWACINSGFRASPSCQVFVTNNQEGPDSSDMVKLLLSQGADANAVSVEVRGCLAGVCNLHLGVPRTGHCQSCTQY